MSLEKAQTPSVHKTQLIEQIKRITQIVTQRIEEQRAYGEKTDDDIQQILKETKDKAEGYSLLVARAKALLALHNESNFLTKKDSEILNSCPEFNTEFEDRDQELFLIVMEADFASTKASNGSHSYKKLLDLHQQISLLEKRLGQRQAYIDHLLVQQKEIEGLKKKADTSLKNTVKRIEGELKSDKLFKLKLATAQTLETQKREQLARASDHELESLFQRATLSLEKLKKELEEESNALEEFKKTEFNNTASQKRQEEHEKRIDGKLTEFFRTILSTASSYMFRLNSAHEKDSPEFYQFYQLSLLVNGYSHDRSCPKLQQVKAALTALSPQQEKSLRFIEELHRDLELIDRNQCNEERDSLFYQLKKDEKDTEKEEEKFFKEHHRPMSCTLKHEVFSNWLLQRLCSLKDSDTKILDVEIAVLMTLYGALSPAYTEEHANDELFKKYADHLEKLKKDAQETIKNLPEDNFRFKKTLMYLDDFQRVFTFFKDKCFKNGEFDHDWRYSREELQSTFPDTTPKVLDSLEKVIPHSMLTPRFSELQIQAVITMIIKFYKWQWHHIYGNTLDIGRLDHCGASVEEVLDTCLNLLS